MFEVIRHAPCKQCRSIQPVNRPVDILPTIASFRALIRSRSNSAVSQGLPPAGFLSGCHALYLPKVDADRLTLTGFFGSGGVFECLKPTRVCRMFEMFEHV